MPENVKMSLFPQNRNLKKKLVSIYGTNGGRYEHKNKKRHEGARCGDY